MSVSKSVRNLGVDRGDVGQEGGGRDSKNNKHSNTASQIFQSTMSNK